MSIWRAITGDTALTQRCLARTIRESIPSDLSFQLADRRFLAGATRPPVSFQSSFCLLALVDPSESQDGTTGNLGAGVHVPARTAANGLLKRRAQ